MNNNNLSECKRVLKDCEVLLQEKLTRPEAQQHVCDQARYFYNFIMWDTEKTATGKSGEIVQISLVSKDGQFCFSEYVMPKVGK